MSTSPTPPALEPLPKIVYAMFCGILDGPAVGRIQNNVAVATQKNVEHVHLAFQSDGGGVGNGVSLYYLFKALPIELTLYNIGAVSSAALIAYLGAKHRKTSASATFMIHRTADTLQFGREAQFRAVADALATNDKVTEALLRRHTTLSAAQWDKLNDLGNLFLTANEAIECGIAEEIGDFSPPAGNKLYTI
jgi:ATP-dependent protease ClpP protease subunit